MRKNNKMIKFNIHNSNTYMLCYLCITWLQLQKLKQGLTESTDQKKYVNLTLEISINSMKTIINYQIREVQSIYQFFNTKESI